MNTSGSDRITHTPVGDAVPAVALVLRFAGVLQREALQLHLPPCHLVGRHPFLHRQQVATPLSVGGSVLACQFQTVSDHSGAPWDASE